ncbi:MAG: CDP-alcohol phosphatidyltransferase family protein [Spirochaetia bacterium]|nr:CDP-alcohol phosphatidyltransferase family protein [Spirochaetota bacterium]MCX8096991.1 CDP-alcohol phosphatidyltransferase family protein [Spirochaetota bacterium]MDW8111926.1 CDP-alcohol phosphatidyltransferase family protein [Spirochaetia bacterium]
MTCTQERSKLKVALVNIFTSLRILLFPIIFILISSGGIINIVVALILFVLGALTDAFDGMIVRKYNLQTKFGFILDPIADKFLVLGTLLAISLVDYLMIPLYFFFIILFRDVLVSILKPISDRNGFPIPTTFFAKLKTTIQFVSIISILVYMLVINFIFKELSKESILSNLGLLGLIPYYTMLLMVLVTIISGIDYIVLFVKGFLRSVKVSRTDER